MANITRLVGPGGLFITAALRRCRSYLVGDKRFPCANVDEHDLRRVLAPGFSPRVEVRELQGHDAQGYSSIVLADARRVPQVRPRESSSRAAARAHAGAPHRRRHGRAVRRRPLPPLRGPGLRGQHAR